MVTQQVDKLATYMANRPAELARLKKAGIKIVGYFPGEYVPDELIYASGAIPLGLLHGMNPRAVQAATPKTVRRFCAFAKQQFGETLLKKDPYYDGMVDMLVVPITCRHLRVAANLWECYTATKNIFRLGIVLEYQHPRRLTYYANTLELLKSRLEHLTGNEITQEKLERAIALYNRMRELLKEISLVRKAVGPPLTASEFVRLNHASFYLDPDLMVEFFTSFREELKQRIGDVHGEERPRIILTGPLLAYGDDDILNIVEEAGGSVVAEEFCEGIRYYWENVEPNGDLIQSLATRYIDKKLPCAFIKLAAEERSHFLIQLAKEFNAIGFIWYQMKFCENYDLEFYYFERKMSEISMPILKLESDYDFADRAPMRTRVETFVYLLKGEG